jgi:hypothetical protein
LGAALAAAACSSGGGGGGAPAGGDAAALEASTPSEAGAAQSTAPWVGTWSCTTGGTLAGGPLPSSSSTVTISASGDTLTIVADATGQAPCSLTATVMSETAAALPAGQSCSLTGAVSATLTLTAGSSATLAGGTMTTTENVAVSNNPNGFDGDTGTLTGTCVKE